MTLTLSAAVDSTAPISFSQASSTSRVCCSGRWLRTHWRFLSQHPLVVSVVYSFSWLPSVCAFTIPSVSCRSTGRACTHSRSVDLHSVAQSSRWSQWRYRSPALLEGTPFLSLATSKGRLVLPSVFSFKIIDYMASTNTVWCQNIVHFDSSGAGGLLRCTVSQCSNSSSSYFSFFWIAILIS